MNAAQQRRRRYAASGGGGGGGGGPASGEFNGTWGFTDFSENTVGVGVPTGWTAINVDTATFEILDAADGGNDSPLAGQMMLWHPPTGATGPITLAWAPVDAPGGEDGEVLALVRHLALDGNNNGIYPGLAISKVTTNNYGTGFGLKSTFFTGGTRWTPTIGEWYSDSALPRIALSQWAWIRHQRLAGAFKGKWWLTTEAEPGTWRSEAAITDAPTGGQPGLLIRSMKNTAELWGCAYFAFTNDPSGTPLTVPSLP